MKTCKHGEIVWRDLTVDSAEDIKTFYENVLGWETTPHDMATYHDYNVHLDKKEEPFTGICHKKESNADIPSVWLNYIYVDDVDIAISKCLESGGSLITKRKMGDSDFAVLKDPAGAMFAVIH